MKRKPLFYLVNGITLYRLLSAPVLLYLVFNNGYELFRWLLMFSFFTDLTDGFLARKFKATSVFGSRLDSVADDLTVAAAIMGVLMFKTELVEAELKIISALTGLFVFQLLLGLIRYGKITSFHTYAAKCAAILQGVFLILTFFLPEPNYPLFYVMSVVTAVELLEEIIIVIVLDKWEADVKGLYWVIRKRRLRRQEA